MGTRATLGANVRYALSSGWLSIRSATFQRPTEDGMMYWGLAALHGANSRRLSLPLVDYGKLTHPTVRPKTIKRTNLQGGSWQSATHKAPTKFPTLSDFAASTRLD